MQYLFSIWVFTVLVTSSNNHESLVVNLGSCSPRACIPK
jgi:hypothetical protein